MTTLALSIPAFPPLTKRTSRAFGLLEVILVFAIVIGAAAVTFAVFDSANGSANADTLVSELNLTAANLRASPMGLTHDYSALSTQTAIQAGIFPSSMIQNGQPTTPFGVIQPAPWWQNSAQFDINTNWVPDDGAACTKMLAGLAASGYDDILVADSNPSASGGSICSAKSPCKLDMSQVTYWCSGQNTPSGLSVGLDLVGH